MPQKDTGQQRGGGQTAQVEGYLNPPIGRAGDGRDLPRKQVRWDDRHFTVIGEGDAKADHQIAHGKIHDPKRQRPGQDTDPQLLRIQQFSKAKPNDEAEEISGYEPSAQEHQAQHQKPLKEVGPGPQRERRPHVGQGIGHTGDRRDTGAGVQHQYHTETVDHQGGQQRDLATDDRALVEVFHVSSPSLRNTCDPTPGHPAALLPVQLPTLYLNDKKLTNQLFLINLTVL